MNRSIYNSPSEPYPSGVSDQHDFEYDESIIDRQTLRRVIGILYEKKIELRALQAPIHQESLCIKRSIFFWILFRALRLTRKVCANFYLLRCRVCVCLEREFAYILNVTLQPLSSLRWMTRTYSINNPFNHNGRQR